MWIKNKTGGCINKQQLIKNNIDEKNVLDMFINLNSGKNNDFYLQLGLK